jgi:hypothetical protein
METSTEKGTTEAINLRSLPPSRPGRRERRAGTGFDGVRSVGAALGGALRHATRRKPARELAPDVIDLLEAAPCLASSPRHLLKPCHRNADSGRHCARNRIAQRIEDLFRCRDGLVRSVPDQVRPGDGAFRIRSCRFRLRGGDVRIDLTISRAEPPSSRAVVAKSGADMGRDGAVLMQIGHELRWTLALGKELRQPSLNRSTGWRH